MTNTKAIKQELEHEEQCALFELAAWHERQYPWLENLFAIPNGGLRNRVVAAKLKRGGVKAGVLDVFLAVPSGKYHGLFIEMKAPGRKLTKDQVKFRDRASKQGYKVVVCYQADVAFKQILFYMKVGAYARRAIVND